MSESSQASLTRAVELRAAPVDHRHESDRLVRSAGFDHRVADHHLDHAGLYDVHARARIVLVEHDASSRVAHARPARWANMRMSISLPFISILVAQGTPRAASLCQKFPHCASFRSTTGSTILCRSTTRPARPRRCGRSEREDIGWPGWAALRRSRLRSGCGPRSAPARTAWPGRQVKIVVAFAPGGSADQFGRLLAAELSAAFRQQFFVENRPGIAGRSVRRRSHGQSPTAIPC